MTKSIEERNLEYLDETVALREKLEGGFIILAERLKAIRDERKFEGVHESFPDFLREIRISEATASKLIGVFEKFVVMGGISPEEVAKVGWTNISLFLPLIQTQSDARRIWDETHLLDRTDAQRTYQEMKTGKAMKDCKHRDTYKLTVCRDCGIKIVDEEAH